MRNEEAYRLAQNLFMEFGEHTDDVAAVSGLILGMLVSGVKIGDKEFHSIPKIAFGVESSEVGLKITNWINSYANDTLKSLLDAEDFELMMPSDNAHISKRIIALIEMTESFLLGIGTKIKNTKDLSSDLQTMISDLIEFTKLDTDIVESNESEKDLMILESYLTLVAQTMFEECAANLYPKANDVFILEEDEESCPVKLSRERELAHEKEAQFWERQAKLGTGRER